MFPRGAAYGKIASTLNPSGTYDPSPAALRPLMDTFWQPAGWRRTPAWPERDIAQAAIEAGVMFANPRIADHDGWVAAARAAARPLSPPQVGEAFLGSLTSGRLDLRSALGSYAVARHLPEHSFSGDGWCEVCHLYVENRRGAESVSMSMNAEIGP